MHIVTMEVYELGLKPSEPNRLASAVIDVRKSSWEAEQLIEQINRQVFPEQSRLEKLKKTFSSFYGKSRMLAFVYTKHAA